MRSGILLLLLILAASASLVCGGCSSSSTSTEGGAATQGPSPMAPSPTSDQDDMSRLLAEASAAHRQGQEQTAISKLDQVLAIDPSNTEARRFGANLYNNAAERAVDNGDIQSARRLAEKACEYEPSNRTLQRNLRALQNVVQCTDCGGTGKCKRCGGSGECPRCRGRGWVINALGDKEQCDSCCGTGNCTSIAGCDGSGKCWYCGGKGYVTRSGRQSSDQ